MVVQTESGRQGAVLCESCARDLMEGFGQAGFGPAASDGAGPGVPMGQPVFGSARAQQTRTRTTQQQDDALVARLATEGFDEDFGARPLQRHVRRTLERELTRAILAGTLTDGARVRATGGDDGGVALEVIAAAAPQLVA
jgi:hypothetical protein